MPSDTYNDPKVEEASQAACRLMLCMRDRDSKCTDQMITYYRVAEPYDLERVRKGLAEAIWSLYEGAVISTREALINAGCLLSGDPTAFYVRSVSLAEKWTICHDLNWPTGDYDVLIEVLGSLASDDCTVL
jgi:hypothetical protein